MLFCDNFYDFKIFTKLKSIQTTKNIILIISLVFSFKKEIQDTSLLKDILLKNRNNKLNIIEDNPNSDCIDGGKCGRNLSYDLKSTTKTSIEEDFCKYDVKLYNSNNNNQTLISDTINSKNNTNHDKLRRTYEEKLLTQLNFEQKRYIIDYQTASTLCYFESTVKRKCIMKNSQKPHFSQWHSYWLQLVGNVLVYYSSKLSLLPSNLITSSTSSIQVPSSNLVTNNNLTSSCNSVNSDSIVCNEQYYLNQQSERKHYHKDPYKMHPIANWMVVALFQDDCSLLSSNINHNHHHHHHHPHNTSSSNSSNCSNTSREGSNHSTNGSSSLRTTTCISVQKKRFDIQLNDLNNGMCLFFVFSLLVFPSNLNCYFIGTMYKYRFSNYKLAKEWYAHFKVAINLHERLKPENLIKFD